MSGMRGIGLPRKRRRPSRIADALLDLLADQLEDDKGEG